MPSPTGTAGSVVLDRVRGILVIKMRDIFQLIRNVCARGSPVSLSLIFHRIADSTLIIAENARARAVRLPDTRRAKRISDKCAETVNDKRY